MPTSSEKSNNTSPTAASAGMDLNGAAAIEACRQIRERMSEFAATLFADTKAGRPAAAEHIRFADGKVFDDRNPREFHDFGPFCSRALGNGSTWVLAGSSLRRGSNSTATRTADHLSTISRPARQWQK